uniref:Uncharacterized protein n=1 Tax=Physcomitrium patens TaxID=3218 RepID=A0A2K1JG65_PHYPA|nr:hypothetical protein PHYPA_017944 [Physcomitrium patens]
MSEPFNQSKLSLPSQSNSRYSTSSPKNSNPAPNSTIPAPPSSPTPTPTPAQSIMKSSDRNTSPNPDPLCTSTVPLPSFALSDSQLFPYELLVTSSSPPPPLPTRSLHPVRLEHGDPSDSSMLGDDEQGDPIQYPHSSLQFSNSSLKFPSSSLKSSNATSPLIAPSSMLPHPPAVCNSSSSSPSSTSPLPHLSPSSFPRHRPSSPFLLFAHDASHPDIVIVRTTAPDCSNSLSSLKFVLSVYPRCNQGALRLSLRCHCGFSCGHSCASTHGCPTGYATLRGLSSRRGWLCVLGHFLLRHLESFLLRLPGFLVKSGGLQHCVSVDRAGIAYRALHGFSSEHAVITGHLKLINLTVR